MLEATSVMYRELIKEAEKHFTPKEVLLIKKGYMVAEDLHRGQKRRSGEPYIIHPAHVAYILLTEAKFYDASTIVAALLHDTIEDTGITKEYLEKHFNTDVANLVEGVTNISDTRITFKKAQDQYDVSLVLNNILRDFRVALIKICDRLHNMRTLEYTKPKKQRYKAAETLSVYCPIALHIGANKIKEELIDLSFKYLCASHGEEMLSESASTYTKIKNIRDSYIEEHQGKIEVLEQVISDILTRHGIKHLIRCKVKSPFNIYQLLENSRNLCDIPNILSFKIEVGDSNECYEAAKILQTHFGVLDYYTKDYIKMPEPNGYQAFHFSALGDDNIPFRLKIYSKDMAKVNDCGLASSIDSTNSIADIQRSLTENNRFIRALEENYQLGNDPFSYIEKTVRSLINNTITVYDKLGSAHTLPYLSTVYDYACSLCSSLDEDASGAYVNGTLVDLEFPLCPGDIIEILTPKLNSTNPSRLREINEANAVI